MAGYAAELQAQIAEKEKRRKMQRQESLRQSQDLLAQRMTVPSGLVSLTVHNPSHMMPVSTMLVASFKTQLRQLSVLASSCLACPGGLVT